MKMVLSLAILALLLSGCAQTTRFIMLQPGSVANSSSSGGWTNTSTTTSTSLSVAIKRSSATTGYALDLNGSALVSGVGKTSTSSATPSSLNLGGSYSASGVTTPKLVLYDDGTNIAGIGIGSGLMYHRLWSTATYYAWYFGATESMRLNGANNQLTVTGTVNTTATVPLHLSGSATVFNDVVVPFQPSSVAASSPVFSETYQSWAFSDAGAAAQEDYGYVALQLPHWYKEGTDMDCHAHIMPTTTGTQNATFELNYIWTNINGVQAAAVSLNATKAMPGTAYNVTLLEWPHITGTGKTLSSTFKARLKRVSTAASDTYGGDVLLDFFDCHVEQDTLGSASELGKWS